MNLKPLAVVKSPIIRTHGMKEKAPYPEQVDVLFITVSLAPCTMLGTYFRYILSIYLISR